MRTIERTCCVCRSKGDKRSLVRLVCAAGNLVWDEFQRLPGRGGYVHLSPQCVSKMGQSARWERMLNLAPGTLVAEQVTEVVRVLMERVNALGAEEASNERECSKSAAGAGKGGKRVRL